MLLLLLALAAPAERPNLDGTWLFDECVTAKHDDTVRFWESVVTVKGDRFTLTKLMGNPKPLTGRLVFDPADPSAVDLVLDELDFAEMKLTVKVPGGAYRGKFDASADRFTLALAWGPGEKRPEKLGPSQTTFFASLTRAPKGFTDFPKEITVRVTGPDGKPHAGASVSRFLDKTPDHKNPDAKTEWKLYDAVKTGPDGTAKVKYDDPPCVVRDEAAKLIAFIKVSPAKLAGGEVSVTLAPEVRITGKVISPELEKAGGKVGWTNFYLIRDGWRLSFTGTKGGEFDLLAPPGKFTVQVYGEDMSGKDVEVVVPPDRTEYALDAIELKASAFALLKGKPAPEFVDVMGWAGKPVKLADLRGQYVLVEFWGFWCGPCIGAMPVLLDLHEKFAGKGLAIVGVHMDLGGDVDTAAKMNAKIAGYVKDVWKGRELPFPNALVSGERGGEDNKPGGTPKLYGVNSYPTTVLIDPEGKIVGKFHARDSKVAVAEMEKLLNAKK